MKNLELLNKKNTSLQNCPPYSNRLYATIANQYIGKEVMLPASRKKSSSSYFIEYINKIPRSIQQRLAIGNAKSWSNMVYLYNSFADELGYAKITTQTKVEESTLLRMCDTKDGDKCCAFNFEDMVYLSDGVYIHKDDCWF